MYVYATYIQMHKCTCVCMVTQLISTQQCVPAIYVFPPLASSVSLPPFLPPSPPFFLPVQVCNHPFLFKEYNFGDENLIRSCGKFALLDRVLPKLQVSAAENSPAV